MCDTEANKHIFVSFIICLIDDNLIINLNEKKQVHDIQIQNFFFWKENFTYWKFKDTISKLFKATHQHNSFDFVLWKFVALVVSVMSEWSIENTAEFPCKISSFSKKYILNKILVMRLVVLYKYMNCTVDKTTYMY